jgi:predicted Rossmann-fold nucleotide-binding protein
MKFVAISGSWRKVNKEIERKVRKIVRQILKRGNGIICGGALGVDYIALNEALKHDKKAQRIKIFLPTTLKRFAQHLRKHARLERVKKEEVEKLISKLKRLKKLNKNALIENKKADFREETKKKYYYQRNTKIINSADELIAFRVITKESQGLGTLDAIKKAKKKGIPVKVFEYNFRK